MEPKIKFDFETTHLIIQKISFIDSFKGEWNVIIDSHHPELKSLQEQAFLDSIGAATRLDGPSLNSENCERLLNQPPGADDALTTEQSKVLGYRDALQFIQQQFGDFQFDEASIFQLYALLLKHADKEETFIGHYKEQSNKGVIQHAEFEHQLFYNTTVPTIIQKETNELLDWINAELDSGKIHPLILTAWFVYEFLSIHPFQYANGRVAKLLMSVLMLKDRYSFIHHISLEKIFELRKVDYFQVLEEGQRHRRRYTERERISEWVIFFLESVEMAIRQLESNHSTLAPSRPKAAAAAKFQEQASVAQTIASSTPQSAPAATSPSANTVTSTSVYLNVRQKKVMAFIAANGPVKIGDITTEFPTFSRNTIKKDLLHFSSSGITNQMGRGRGTFYTSS